MILSENRISIFGVMRNCRRLAVSLQSTAPPFGCARNALTVKSLQANPFASKPEHKLSNMNRA
jgi:hypothetical protein